MSEDVNRTEGQQDSCGVEEASATVAAEASARRPIMRIDARGYLENSEHPFVSHIDGRYVRYSLDGGIGGQHELIMRATLDDGREERWTSPEPVMNYSESGIGRAMAALARELRSVLRTETPEDLAYFSNRQAEWDRQQQERWAEERRVALANSARREEERRVARERAEATLRKFLSADQNVQYTANKYFDVVGGSSGQTYRILPGSEGNVALLNDQYEDIGVRYCAGPRQDDGSMPVADIMLAQALILDAAEIEYFRKANLYHGRRWPTKLPGLREVLQERGYVYNDQEWADGGRSCSCCDNAQPIW